MATREEYERAHFPDLDSRPKSAAADLQQTLEGLLARQQAGGIGNVNHTAAVGDLIGRLCAIVIDQERRIADLEDARLVHADTLEMVAQALTMIAGQYEEV